MLIESIKTLLKQYGATEKEIENFINDLKNGICNPLIMKKEMEDATGLDIDSIIENAKYSKEDVALLMKRRVARSHRNFFDRYGVCCLEELDAKVKKGEKLDSIIDDYNQYVRKYGPINLKDSDVNDLNDFEKIDKEIVGLVDIKKQIKRVVSLAKKQKDDAIKNNNVFCFLGKSGSGKTMMAQMVASILNSNGIIPSAKVTEFSAHQLAYSGCAKTFEQAENGVLLIDHFDLLEPDTDAWFYREYGKQTLFDLSTEIDYFKNKVVVIFAGEEKAINKILDIHQNLKSRISLKLKFPDYTVDELMQIGDLYLKKRNYLITDAAKNEVRKVIEYLKPFSDFANARSIINIYQSIFAIQAERTAKEFTNREIDIKDVKLYAKEIKIFRTINSSNDSSTVLLNRLIGLDKVKTQVKRFRAFAQKHKEDFTKNNNLHMCFTGNPGTGKTEVGKIIAKIMFEDGIFPSDKLTFATRADLVAEYVGQTAPKVRQIVKDSLGGVLFIDEAYSLLTGYGSNYDYGAEAIAELVSCMEEYRGQFMVIFAGYKTETIKLIESNTGLKSRVNHFINFENYNEKELRKILELMLFDSKYQMTDECKNKTCELLKKLSKEDDFGNARTVISLIEKMFEIQALRSKKLDDFNLTIEDIGKLIEEDYPKIFEEEKSVKFNLKKLQKFSDSFSEENVVSYIEPSTVLIEKYENDRLIGEGTGFFIEEKGMIATNNHVVENADNIKVKVNIITIKNEKITKTYDCSIVKKDKLHDLAVICINEPDMTYSSIPLYFGDDYHNMVRNKIFMGGYPLGGSRFKKITLNQGAIQSYNKDQKLKDDEKELDWLFLEIGGGYSGNSGSAVLNENGICIGVYSGSAVSYDKVGPIKIRHAIPVKYLIDLLKQK